MASIETYYFNFPDGMRDEIQVTQYRPDELRVPGISDTCQGLGTPSTAARDIAKDAVTVLQRARVENMGADTMAHRLLEGGYDTYVAKHASYPGANDHTPIGYAQTELAGGNVLRIKALEVYDPTVDQRLLWTGAAALMACAIYDHPHTSLEVYPREYGVETRGPDFFVKQLGMRLIGRRPWGRKGTKLVGNSEPIMDKIRQRYPFTTD